MKKTYRLSALALAMLMGMAQAAGEVTQWRFGDDLLGNAPGSPWYYGWRNLAGQTAQALDATATIGSQRGRYTRVVLSGRRDTFQPGIWTNIGTTAINSVKPGEVALRPGPQRQPAFVRWTAPADGAYRLEARFGAGNAPAVDLLVTKNGVTGFSANNETREREFSTSVQLKAGDQLEFSATNTTSGLDNQVPLQLLIRRETLPPTPPVVVPLPPTAGSVSRQIDYDGRGSLVSFQIGDGQYGRRLLPSGGGQAPAIVVRENGRDTHYREEKQGESRTVDVERGGENTRFVLDGNGRVLQRLGSRGLGQSYNRSLTGDAYSLILEDPDRTRTEIAYDTQGRPRMVRDGRGKVANYIWSDTSVQINYGPGENANFQFGPPGVLRDASNEVAALNYQYYDGTRLSQFTQKIGPISLRQTFDYQSGQLYAHTYPSGRRVEYVLSGMPDRPQVQALRFNNIPLLSNIQYAENGEPKSWTWPNGRVWQASYDLAGRPSGVTLGNHNEIVRHDPSGVLESLDIGYGPQRYLYGQGGALTEARIGSDVYGYEYGAGANRVAQRVNGNEIRYHMAPMGNRVYRVSGTGTDRPWAYDTTGNRVDEGNGLLELYNQANRLVMYGNWSYSYGPDGARVIKKAPDGGQTLYGYAPDGKLIGEFEPSGAPRKEIIWFKDRPVALWSFGNLYLIMTDHLKTPRQLVSLQTGKVVWDWSSDEPFGANRPDEDYDRDGVPVVFNLRFPGHYYDAESNRHYAGSRYYEPASGRYLQLGAWRPFDLENPYAYANQLPASYTSPDGGASRSLIQAGAVKLGQAKSPGMVTTTGYAIHSLTQGAKPLLDSLPARPAANAVTVRTPAPLLLWRDETREKLEANYR